MAYPINVNSILEITFEMFFDDQQVMSLFHYKHIGGGTIADGRAAALAAITAIGAGGNIKPTYAACVSNTIDNIHTYAQWITPIRYAYVTDPGADWVGTVVDDPFPSNVAVALTKGSDRAGRHFNGTLHMPGVPLSFVVGSTVTNDALGAYAELADAMRLSVIAPGGAELAPVIFNRVTPSDSPLITQVIPRNYSRVMRRRTVGVGS